MLEAKISERGCTVTASGSGIEVLADLTILIHNIYASMYRQDKKLANSFRAELTRAMVDPRSPAWDPEMMAGAVGFMVTMPREQEG